MLYRILRVRAYYLDVITDTHGGTGKVVVELVRSLGLPIPENSTVLKSFVRCFRCPTDGDYRRFGLCTSCFGKGREFSWTLSRRQQYDLSPLERYDYEQHFATSQSVGAIPAESCLAGDTVWAIGGADVPFVLRRIEDHYILIGACYLRGATKRLPCGRPWPMVTQIIDIW